MLKKKSHSYRYSRSKEQLQFSLLLFFFTTFCRFFRIHFGPFCVHIFYIHNSRFSHRFQPNNGANVQAKEKNQIPSMRRRAPLMDIGLPDKPLTITLYLSNAIIVIVQMEPHPNREPAKAYISQTKGPSTHVS